METAVKTLTMRVWEAVSGTAVNCERDGHCWHEGTAIGSHYCCKCGIYEYPSIYYPASYSLQQ